MLPFEFSWEPCPDLRLFGRWGLGHLGGIGGSGIGSQAEDGLMALELLRASTVDVIVSDIRMPRLDGPGLLHALRASGDVTPLVFLTGYGDYSDQ